MRSLLLAFSFFFLSPLFSEYEKVGPAKTFDSSNHWLRGLTILNNNSYTLELEDGSVWKISCHNEDKALDWQENDPLTITQNNRWFSKHDYRIINKSNGTSVEATLFLGPVELGEFSRFIIGIDYIRRTVLLNDMTQWEISDLDSYPFEGWFFEGWFLNDFIIIGTNSNTSIWDSGSDALLINVNQNNCARAKQSAGKIRSFPKREKLNSLFKI